MAGIAVTLLFHISGKQNVRLFRETFQIVLSKGVEAIEIITEGAEAGILWTHQPMGPFYKEFPELTAQSTSLQP